MKDWLQAHLPESIFALVTALVGWLAQRAIAKVDRHEDRLAELERNSVTKETIDELRQSMNFSITHAFARVESRTDEILLHLAQRDDR